MIWFPIEVLKARIEALDDTRFVELCNMLLAEIAAAHGVSRAQLSLNYNLQEPDGGIDARCVGASSLTPRIMPRSNTDYQFKSGRGRKSVAAIAREDILAKPRVLAGLEAGHAFVILSSWDRGDRVESSLRTALRKEGISVDADQLSFFGAGSLAHIVEAHPSIIARFLVIDASGMMDITRWASSPPMSNPYQSDATVDARIADLRRRIQIPGATVRVVGAAGDGKTRIVLEALRDTNLAGGVLYFPQASDLTPSLQSHILLTQDTRCTLVVDEVESGTSERLVNYLSSRSTQVRLVMIGLDASGRPQLDTLQVEGLSEELLTKTVLAIVPGLDPDIARSIARDCERSPKLAVLLAGLLREDPSLLGVRALKHGSVASTLDRYLGLDDSSLGWKAISTSSLLMHVGWTGDAEHESTALFEAVGLDVVDARRAVDRLHERYGIAPMAGRLRYVSPAILADHLAARQLAAWTTDHLKRVFASFTPSMADSFSRRARRLSAILPNRAIVEEVILGDQGPFRTLADLESSGMSTVLHRLAAPFPWGVLEAVERCLSDITPEELKQATNSRRDCVWALEEIQWREDTFERASRLLLRLAISENETWGNNATNDWPATFQTMLGRTAAGAAKRHKVVRFAASLPEVSARVLATEAIRAAFQTGHLSRMGNPPSDVEGMPAREWTPATYGEWWDSLTAYLEILETLVNDESAEVKTSAVKILGDIVNDLFRVSQRVVERWQRIAESLVDAPLDIRSLVFSDLDWAIDRWTEVSKNEDWPDEEADPSKSDASKEERRIGQREAVQLRLGILQNVRNELQGEGFQAQLRALLSRRPWLTARGTNADEWQAEFSRDLNRLANEAVVHPELMDGQWQWLLNHESWPGSETFIEAVGKLDRSYVFKTRLQRLAETNHRGRTWFTVYALARAEADNNDALIDVFVAEQLASGASLSAFEMLIRSNCTDLRLKKVIEVVREKLISPADLQQITYSGWIRVLSPDHLREIITTANADDSTLVDLVPLLEGYLRLHPTAAPSLMGVSLDALAAPMARGVSHNTYEWAQLAKRFIAHSPIKMGELVLQQIGSIQTAHDSELTQLLDECWKLSDKVQFFENVITPWLYRDSAAAWWAREVIEYLPIRELGTDYLIHWVRDDPAKRAYMLAKLIRAPFGRPSDLHARLLSDFDEYEVGAAFSADYHSGTFTGSAAEWLRGKLTFAQEWAKDDRSAVRKWGEHMVKSLEESLRHAESREAEERLSY